MILITFRGLATGIMAVVKAKQALSRAITQAADGDAVHGELREQGRLQAVPSFANDRSR